MSLYPQIEKQSPEAINIFQESELKKIIRYVSENSLFYQRHFKKHGITSDRINTLKDLLTVPPTTKEDLQHFNWDFLCVPRSKVIEYTSTSGTLGKPVTIALSEKDMQRLAYNESISFACAETTSDDIFQLMLTLDRQFMAGIAYHEGLRKLGAGIIRIGPGLPSMQWDSIERLKPTGLIAVPSFLVKLIEFAKENNIDLNRSSVRKVICIGEGIRTSDFELNTLGKQIKEAWNIDLFGTYASTEMQTAFTECVQGKGGHHHPELIIVEILNDNNLPVAEGEAGEVTITTLGVEGMPLVRYKTGDIASAHNEACACGRTTMRLGPVLGRKQQMIKLKGTTLYPPAIFEILHEASITDYAVEVFTNDLGVDDLTIYIGSTNGSTSQASVKNIFQSRLRIAPNVVFCSKEEIEAKHVSVVSRKLQKFIDKRN